MCKSNDRRQRGVALITAVLIVALVTTVAATMASRQQLDIRRTSNLFDADRAWLFALGGEDWARGVLRRDAEEGDVDHLGEDWAEVLPPLVVEGAVLGGALEDMQGRFNLNNLVNAQGEPVDVEIKRFERLLTLVELESNLAAAVVDWVDENVDPLFPDGAEDDVYMGESPGYRAANRPMASASELALVKGIGYEGYQKLLPYVTALPERTPLNVNTAPALVLATVVDDLSEADGEALVEARGEEGFTSVEDFLGQSIFNDLEIDQSTLSVSSDYFLITAAVEFGRSRTTLFGLLSRTDDGEVVTLTRGRGAY